MNIESKQLLMRIQSLIRSARHMAARGVNTLQVMTNFEIGCLIVEHEQKWKKRAEYGKQMLQELSRELSSEFGRGFSRSNLEYMRRFFLEYRGADSKDSPDGVWEITRIFTEKSNGAKGTVILAERIIRFENTFLFELVSICFSTRDFQWKGASVLRN